MSDARPKVRITLKKGLAGKPRHIKETAYSLGLFKTNRCKVVALDKAVYGKIVKLKDFVDFEILEHQVS